MSNNLTGRSKSLHEGTRRKQSGNGNFVQKGGNFHSGWLEEKK